ncbi:ribonuclease H-like domain-containing protein [Tanacetum coccineum]
MSTYPMVTRAKAGIFKPLERMNCHVTTTSPLPHSHVHALRDPNWKEAMLDEYNALITNGTWVLVPRPANVNVVRSMWLFKHKFNADGSLSWYKARLVANGRSEQQGIDCDETFSPVVKPATIRTVLSLAVSREWPIHQLDMKNAFFHGHLTETRTASSMFLSQSNFAMEILERANMQKCNPCKTPVDTESKLCPDGEPVSDPTLYHSLAGALQYLTFTRPDLSYAFQQVCLYMHDPRDPHFTALKCILRYVCGTIDHVLQLHVSSTAQLTAYTDADWAGCPVTRRSTSGYCVFLGDNLLSWSAKRHVTLSRSSAEAEYRGVANVVAETAWLRNLLLELHAPLSTATIVYCDNVSVVYLSTNPVQHQRTKHIEIDIHFVRDYVASGQVRVLHVPSRYFVKTCIVDNNTFGWSIWGGSDAEFYKQRLPWKKEKLIQSLPFCALCCINVLQRKNSHIPYRNSKLTQVLEDSLGADSKTLMHVHVSPKEKDLCETVCSLNFALRLRSIRLGKTEPNEAKAMRELAMNKLQLEMQEIENNRDKFTKEIKKLNQKLYSLTKTSSDSNEIPETVLEPSTDKTSVKPPSSK